jgi:DNA polymerase-3 subunit gamma/tau
MGQALYRTHRPKKLSEVVGQEHITKTLEQAIKQGRISHAYLFTGPRGIGKTSVARILAHDINGLPYTDDNPHMDIIEIDAASNRRIDEIRELRDKVHVAPTSAKYKVYIIDEVHMLTREAFNALLKTLEEPPGHVVFILATTDAHKLPETIISRAQRFSFRPVDKAKVIAHLRDIAKREKITISDEALELLADHGEGSFRDSISLLDQAGSQTAEVTAKDVQRLLGIPPVEAIQQLLELTLSGADAASLMSALTSLYNQGYQAEAIAKRLGLGLRARLVERQVEAVPALRLLSRLIKVPTSHDPDRFLEIVLLGNRPDSNRPNVTALTNDVKPQKPPTVTAEAIPEPPVEPKAADKPKNLPKKTKTAGRRSLSLDVWPDILQALKQQHNTLYSVVRMAQPDFSEAGTLKLAFAFAFHQKRLNENANRQKLADIIHELTGQTVKIDCLYDKTAAPPKLSVPSDKATPDDLPDNADLTAISNIFGGAELLES